MQIRGFLKAVADAIIWMREKYGIIGGMYSKSVLYTNSYALMPKHWS